jgi:TRAP transporter TAXI family solute receptor
MRAALARLGLLALLALPAGAAAADLGLITGNEHGTYHRFGQDLQRLARRAGLTVILHPSRGAMENMVAVAERADVQLGIVQSDVLLFVADQRAHPVLGRLGERVAMVFPLYDEHVHVLARREITGLDQLAGKRVAVGSEGSGTHLTARWLFKLAEVTPAEMRPIEPAQALPQLKAGHIDALVYVAAAPVGLLAHQVNADDGLALVPLEHKSIVDAYGTADIPAGTYPWQPAAVSTVAVKAVLVSAASGGPACDAVARLAQQVAGGRDWLAQHGHPRWRDVDLDAPVWAGRRRRARADTSGSRRPTATTRRRAPASAIPSSTR